MAANVRKAMMLLLLPPKLSWPHLLLALSTAGLVLLELQDSHTCLDRFRGADNSDAGDESRVGVSGPDGLNWIDRVLFCIVIAWVFELLNYVSLHLGVWLDADPIPVRGKHLDDLSRKDKLFILLSKASTGPFTYLYLRFAYYDAAIPLRPDDLTLANTILPLPLLFIVYDFFYTLLHWLLHIKAIYGHVHKHHHFQKAPSRANIDAVNVHPLEYHLGEYNHLLALYLCSRHVDIHIMGSLLFLAVGGVLAGLNHTRFDVAVHVVGLTWYDSKAHDVHHRLPQSNYGQYIMLWDYVFGTYRAYNATDRVNPAAQLDPATGKTVVIMDGTDKDKCT